MNGRPLPWRLFELPFRPWLRLRLKEILVAGLPAPESLAPSSPLLLVANHPSWFDGFLLREIQRQIRPQGTFLTFMLERELRRHPWLRWLGGIGFDPDRPQSLRRALRTASGHAMDPGGLTVAFFPQGSIQPSWDLPYRLAPGIRGVARVLAPCTLLPVALHLELGAAPSPTAFVLAGSPLRMAEGDRLSMDWLSGQMTAVSTTLLGFIQSQGEETARRWPSNPRESLPTD